MLDTKKLRSVLANYIREAATFRASKIDPDRGNPKNERYLDRLEAVASHFDSLPDDNPRLKELAQVCAGVEDFTVPSDEWNTVIHCDDDDPAEWADEWLKSLVDLGPDAFDGDRCIRCGRKFEPGESFDLEPGETLGDDIVQSVMEEACAHHIADQVCAACLVSEVREKMDEADVE